MAELRERDPSEERAEIREHVGGEPEVEPLVQFNETVGRLPVGPARGWRARERRAKTCERCEGDQWIEDDAGSVVRCSCREPRLARRADRRLRKEGWRRGTSLSFAAPPLASIPPRVRDGIEGLCADMLSGGSVSSTWIIGEAEGGKSALCAYMAQRLYSTDRALVGRTGNLLSHLRWLGATRGEGAIDECMEQLAEIPLLVLDDIDRAARTHPPTSSLALHGSYASQDLIRLAGLVRDRQGAMLPTVVTSRAEPSDCASRLATITRKDLLRGLLATALDQTSPFEDFPDYPMALLGSALRGLGGDCVLYDLDPGQTAAVAA